MNKETLDLNDVTYKLNLVETMLKTNNNHLRDLSQSKSVEFDFKAMSEDMFNVQSIAFDLVKETQGMVDTIQQRGFDEAKDN